MTTPDLLWGFSPQKNLLMSFTKVWIHSVWATRGRKPLLTQDVRPALFQHILENAVEKGILIDCVNGHQEHAHCLFRLRPDDTLRNLMQLIKGESSFWFNKSKMSRHKLIWQNDYFAVSVSESQVNKVRNYIARQEEHHRKKSFQEEYDEFVSRYGFQVVKG
jgi:REP element-mobilizing transposase RayT